MQAGIRAQDLGAITKVVNECLEQSRAEQSIPRGRAMHVALEMSLFDEIGECELLNRFTTYVGGCFGGAIGLTNDSGAS
jgi:hypothetical protein